MTISNHFVQSAPKILACLFLLIFCSCRFRGSSMSGFVDDYFDSLFEWSPTTATGIGFHQYDSKIEDLSAGAIQSRIQKLKQLQTALGMARRGVMSADERIDAEILDGQINAELLDLETLGTWRHNPMIYVGLPGNAVDVLMKRNFAPPAERLRSVISR